MSCVVSNRLCYAIPMGQNCRLCLQAQREAPLEIICVKRLEPTTEDDMIAVFLAGERTSERFGAKVRSALKSSDANQSIITNPDISDSVQNTIRRKVLREARGYGKKTSWFAGLPDDIRW